ncbi:hypothetical protein DHW03_15060 [Pedobacter yonginense]|uniref:Uncharacterized protein n=1 Tax=Pedobacter yonginense TaxID=651869 RepID=A0A317EI80_9SPHI|nr:hypothetical protein [Pedobacter yonginense]PWS26115.1 hypothetical protein DHW03_15060 [Pedobacter yonginense]
MINKRVARKGFLDHSEHTSNALFYLQNFAVNYSGSNNYKDELAVTDNNIITANGIAPIEFPREIFKTLKLYDKIEIEKWFQLFKHGIWTE